MVLPSPTCLFKALSPASGGQLFGCVGMILIRALCAGDLEQRGFSALVGLERDVCVTVNPSHEW